MNGPYGTGKTYTLFLGMQRLVEMLQKDTSETQHLILFLSIKEGHRQCNAGHLKDSYDIFLKDMIKKNKKISFMIIEDLLELASRDSGLLALCGDEFQVVGKTKDSRNVAAHGLLDYIKKIFIKVEAYHC